MKLRNLKGPIICIAVAIGLLFLKDNIGVIWDIICFIASALTPFVYGFIIAYVLNFPYKFFQNKVFGKLGKKNKVWNKINNPVSLITAYVLVFGIIGLIIGVIVPELTVNITGLVANLPNYFNQFQSNVNDLIAWAQSSFGFHMDGVSSLNDLISKMITTFTGNDISKFTQNILDAAFPVAVNTAVTIYNWVMGIIISIYLLTSKEKLCMQMKRLAVAVFPIKWLPKLYEFVDVMDTKCGRFIVGKVIDSTIIGVMCFIAMSILQLDYALLISFIVAIFNIIPFFGPFISAIPSAFLLLLIDPLQSLIFIIMIIVLQQIDGNLIGPKVVGDKVGLFGFWTLFSVIVGGGLFGFTGLILGTPIFAAVYTLIGKRVGNAIREKGKIAQEALDFEVLRYSEIAEQQKRARKKNEESQSSVARFLHKELERLKKDEEETRNENPSEEDKTPASKKEGTEEK